VFLPFVRVDGKYLMSLPSSESLGLVPTTVVPIAWLLPSDSPRLDGVNVDHVRTLAEIDTDVPPILVHRGSMRVIDGMHRLQAAIQRGRETIEVRFVDSEERDLFVLAVETNIKHGLPLSQRDRVAAATRVAASHPHWSDRLIADLTGMSAKTVAAIRKRSSEDIARVEGRVGRDGRVRPLDTSHGRQLASTIMADRPEASLREVAKATGLSLGTVRDVRRRLCRGEDPVPDRQRGPEKETVATKPAIVPPPPEEQLPKMLEQLRADPSLRFSNAGRAVLRLLDSHSIPAETWTQLADSIPPHCVATIASIARGCAVSWMRFAEHMEDRDATQYSQVGS
jgi:ParB-like chromosome segregation protein Spo0J